VSADPFDLVERDFVARAVVELGRAGLVRGHGLGILKGAADLEIGGDAGRPEHGYAGLGKTSSGRQDRWQGAPAVSPGRRAA
jgi:hypothetical protein